MSGNEVGALLLNYILSERTALGTMPKEPVAVKTIVSTDLCYPIADKYGCQMIDVLTGFKFIGEQIGLLEQKGEDDRFVFGFEESYGYLAGSYVRDKDAVVASMLICEMASFYKARARAFWTRWRNCTRLRYASEHPEEFCLRRRHGHGAHAGNHGRPAPESAGLHRRPQDPAGCWITRPPPMRMRPRVNPSPLPCPSPMCCPLSWRAAPG